MIKYHPEARFLTDYVAGSLPAPQALCVASHLHYCQACRVKVPELTELGAEPFMAQEAVAVRADEFSALLRRIEAPQPPADPVLPLPPRSTLPRALHRATGGNLDALRWRRFGRNFRRATLDLGRDQRETFLFYIKAGGSVPQHRHLGDEITVILKGSFSDHEDQYAEGDFVVRTRGEIHRPVASQDQDCLCLSTLEAPIRMRSWLLRLLVPLMERVSA